MSKKRKQKGRKKPLLVLTLENKEALYRAIQRDEEAKEMLTSLAMNLSRLDFRPGLQPDGSVIEI